MICVRSFKSSFKTETLLYLQSIHIKGIDPFGLYHINIKLTKKGKRFSVPQQLAC